MYDGKSFKYGSLKEALAINIFNQNRNKELLQPIFSVVDPAKADKLLKQYRGVLFPEEKWDDLKYLKKAKDMFDRMRGMSLTVKPL